MRRRRRSRGAWTIVGVVALAGIACHARRPVRSSDLAPSLSVRAELTPPRLVPGVDRPVNRVDGVVRAVSADSVWVEPTSARTITGAVFPRESQPAVALPRDSTVRLTSSQPSPRRTWILVAGLVASAALLAYGANESIRTSGY